MCVRLTAGSRSSSGPEGGCAAMPAVKTTTATRRMSCFMATHRFRAFGISRPISLKLFDRYVPELHEARRRDPRPVFFRAVMLERDRSARRDAGQLGVVDHVLAV